MFIMIARPVFRYFTPLGPRNFCAPPYLFVFSYVQLSNSLSSFQRQQRRNEKTRYQHCFQYRSPLNFSLVDSLFFSRILYFNLDFFNMPPLKICRPGPGPRGPVRKYGQCNEWQSLIAIHCNSTLMYSVTINTTFLLLSTVLLKVTESVYKHSASPNTTVYPSLY